MTTDVLSLVTLPMYSLPTVDERVDSPILPGFREADFDDQTLVEALDHLAPPRCKEGGLIPLDTFLGNSIIPPSYSSELSRVLEAGPGGSSTSYSWSRGLGFETSPIKTRSERKKANLSRDSFEVVTLSTGSDTGAFRGLKSLARAKT